MIVLVCGTRPELVKLYPVCHELRARGVEFRVLFTGQHTTLAETVNFLDTFREQTTSLTLPSEGTPYQYVARATSRIARELECLPGIHWVIVQGDTSSALAGARAAAASSLPLAHVEAGLRTFDFADPYPEEHFRVEISRLTTRHFAVTTVSRQNLLAEGVKESDIALVGNTVVDMLRLHDIIPTPSRHHRGILVTLHRRESAGEPMRHILSGLQAFASLHPDIPIRIIGHPNGLSAAQNPGFQFLPPMPYLAFVQLLRDSQAVLTDSGGVIEEATTLQIPCVIARNHTERPEGDQIFSFLAGTRPGAILHRLERAIEHEVPSTEPNPFGSGYASYSIVNSLIGQ